MLRLSREAAGAVWDMIRHDSFEYSRTMYLQLSAALISRENSARNMPIVTSVTNVLRSIIWNRYSLLYAPGAFFSSGFRESRHPVTRAGRWRPKRLPFHQSLCDAIQAQHGVSIIMQDLVHGTRSAGCHRRMSMTRYKPFDLLLALSGNPRRARVVRLESFGQHRPRCCTDWSRDIDPMTSTKF
jgi:hypothetical protein